MIEDRYTLTDLPQIGESYHEVDWFVPKNKTTFIRSFSHIFKGDGRDYKIIAAGAAFKTHEAAERNKYAVYKALTGREWGKE